MQKNRGRLRWGALGAAFAASSLLLAACGDDEKTDPEKVAIEATGSGKQVTYSAPAEVSAGAAEIEFTNSTDGETDAQLVRVEGEYSEDEVIGELGKAIEGEAVAEWFEGGGGVGATKAGETKTVTQELEPGTYYLTGGEEPQPPLPKIEVGDDDDGAELDDPEAKVTAEDYSFSGEGLKAGESEVLLENDGEQWHHFIAAQITEGKTIDDVKAFLESEFGGSGGPPQGPPPFDERSGFESTVLEGGTSQVANVELKPGDYAFLCFISDKQGGPPHAAKGMVSEVTVEE